MMVFFLINYFCNIRYNDVRYYVIIRLDTELTRMKTLKGAVMINIFKPLCWMLVLTFLLMLPFFIPIGSQSLMDWQIETLHWNYIGVSANFILFFIYLW